MRRKANDFVVALVRLFGPFGPKPAERVLRASAGQGFGSPASTKSKLRFVLYSAYSTLATPKILSPRECSNKFGIPLGLFDFGYAQDTFASGMLK
jgi:hypothetical protein